MFKNFIRIFAALIIGSLIFTVPFSALAAEGEIDETVTPYLYCVYYNSAGEEVDGNRLTEGDYRVDVMLEGMETLSVFQYTAEYNPNMVTSLSTEAAITSEYEELRLGGIKEDVMENGNNRVAFVVASSETDEVGTALDHGNAVTISTMQVTVDCDSAVIDFEDVFTFAEDPDLTFTEADYGVGIEFSYVINTNEETTYNKPNITADVTPENEVEPDTITVSGRILIAADAEGNASNFGLRGVKIYAYDNDNNVIAATVSNAEGDKATWGDYSLTVPVGTTQFEVGDPVKGADSIVNRPFTIKGDADVTGANVPVIMCDYNDNGIMDGTDKSKYNTVYKSYDIYADFNNNAVMDGTDKSKFNTIYKTKTVLAYTETLHFD